MGPKEHQPQVPNVWQCWSVRWDSWGAEVEIEELEAPEFEPGTLGPALSLPVPCYRLYSNSAPQSLSGLNDKGPAFRRGHKRGGNGLLRRGGRRQKGLIQIQPRNQRPL